MHNIDATPVESLVDSLLGEASWFLSHAQALSDCGQEEDARAELARAANCEEQAASLLDAAGREREAVVHRVSAASCREQLGEYGRAVTLLRAALSVPLPDEYQGTLEVQLARCLGAVEREPVPLRTRGTDRHAVRAR